MKPSGLDHPVFCRVATSDIYDYSHLLGPRKIPFHLPFRPEYIVDAGANVGYSALRFHLDYPGATIVAIEPEIRNVMQFRKNCAPYPNIHLEEAALWPRNTRLQIKSLDADQNAFQIRESPTGTITAFTVHELMKRHNLPRIDLFKIDIEGSEKALFSENTSWLEHVGMLLIETHDRFEPGCTDAINKATEGRFLFRGIVDEYSFFEAAS